MVVKNRTAVHGPHFFPVPLGDSQDGFSFRTIVVFKTRELSAEIVCVL